MSDELDGIFENLTPADFLRETSAATAVRDFAVRHFAAFTKVYLQAARFAYEASDGEINPTAVMESGDKTRIFTPDDDELLIDYINRLRREAVRFRAERLFICILTEAADMPIPKEVGEKLGVAMDDPSVVEYARENGLMRPSIAWYAEEVGAQLRCGIITIEDGHTADIVDARPEERSDLFASILSDLR